VQFPKDHSSLFWVVFYVEFANYIGSESSVEKKGKGEKCVSMGIHPLVKVLSSGEGVSDCVGMSRDVLENKVEVL
jgi:hypothetical protein